MSQSETHVSLWGGRFTGGPSQALAALSVSTHFDFRLAHVDIAGSHAHADELHRVGLLTDQECADMHDALARLDADVTSGGFVPSPDDEDVHTALERGLIDRAGATLGGKLRAGRSRNDQIATLIRVYLRQEARHLAGRILDIASALLGQAERAGDAVMPGRTHMQHAQPVLVAHHLLAHVWPLLRDVARLRDWDKRAAISPYGSGALAGNTLGMDPRRIAAALGFTDSVENSIDGTSARDVVAEFSFICAQIGIDISRLSEEIVIWNTKEFGYVTLDDAYSTGSSIMPQKKNPDVAELARGKAGRLIGDLTALLAVLKALPLAYDRDLQEDKEPVFDQIDTLDVLCPAVAGMIDTMTIHLDRLAELAPQGFSLATDIAEWLVKRGVPFRDAHGIIGRVVLYCLDRGIAIDDMKLEELRQFSPAFDGDIYQAISMQTCVAKRLTIGAPGPEAMAREIALAKSYLEKHPAMSDPSRA